MTSRSIYYSYNIIISKQQVYKKKMKTTILDTQIYHALNP